jgi:hypothetical protein
MEASMQTQQIDQMIQKLQALAPERVTEVEDPALSR